MNIIVALLKAVVDSKYMLYKYDNLKKDCNLLCVGNK